MSSAFERHNARMTGDAETTVMFAHGFGCDQNMWRFVAPTFDNAYTVLAFDYIGAGGADVSAYDPDRYAALAGYADDVVDLARAAGLLSGVFVGHSVSSIVGVLAAKKAPELFEAVVMVSPPKRGSHSQCHFRIPY